MWKKRVREGIEVPRWLFMVYLLFSAIIFTAVIWKGDHLSKPADIQRVTLPAFRRGTPKRAEPGFSFHHFMDSVLQEATLSARLDSLRRARPGFADTLRRLEEIYK